MRETHSTELKLTLQTNFRDHDKSVETPVSHELTSAVLVKMSFPKSGRECKLTGGPLLFLYISDDVSVMSLTRSLL